jgi:transcription elongation factor Elf1
MEIQCPNCGEKNTLTVGCAKEEENVAHCNSCEADFTLSDLRQVSESLACLVTWIESGPFRK